MSDARISALAMQLGDLTEQMQGLDGSLRGLVALEGGEERWAGFLHGARVTWTLCETSRTLSACIGSFARLRDHPEWAQEMLALDLALPKLLMSETLGHDPAAWNTGMGVWFERIHELLAVVADDARSEALDALDRTAGLTDADLDALRGP